MAESLALCAQRNPEEFKNWLRVNEEAAIIIKDVFVNVNKENEHDISMVRGHLRLSSKTDDLGIVMICIIGCLKIYVLS